MPPIRALLLPGLIALTLTAGCDKSAPPASPATDGSTDPAPPPPHTDIGGLKVGDDAPDFELVAHDGTSVSLAALREKGPVVVVFYRGDWCPICRKQLGGMQDELAAFGERGASLIALSVDDQAKNAALAEKLGVTFPLLADTDLATIRAYDVEHTGEDIARPSTYVVTKDGKVAWAWVGERAGDRPDLEHILAAIPRAE